MWKCSVCGYIHNEDAAPDKCPKCGAPKEKFIQLTEEQSNLVLKSERTNYLHQRLCVLMEEAIEICKEGIEIDLDPGCVVTFKKGKNDCEIIRNIAKAEIAAHVGKNKW